MGNAGTLRNFPFFFYYFGVGYGLRFRSSDIKKGNKDKGAQQVCIRDLIGFGLSGPSALPDCQTWALCLFAVWENCVAGGNASCSSPQLDFGCVGPLGACLHQTYSICSGVCVCYSAPKPASVCHTHTHTCGWLMFMFFREMLVLGCVFVCAGPAAQYRSHSLWSLRGSPPPALPPVSALFGAPGLQ